MPMSHLAPFRRVEMNYELDIDHMTVSFPVFSQAHSRDLRSLKMS